MKKTWQQKLHNASSWKVEVTDKKFADVPEGSKLLIPTPEIVDAYIKNIPHGIHTSLPQMRKDLAAAHDAAYSCPITSGIFLRIAAEAAYEELMAGKTPEEVTPFWRMIDKKSAALKKLSFGVDFVQQQRKKEGLSF